MDTDDESPPPVKKLRSSGGAAAKPGTSSEKRTKCKYWKKCFRKDKGHKALYIHPGDPDEKQAAVINVKGKSYTCIHLPNLKPACEFSHIC